MWFGYVTFGFMADAIGRKRTYVLYLLVAAVLLPPMGSSGIPWRCCCSARSWRSSAPATSAASGAVIAELYPTAVRATAAGVCYNIGRIASAAAPLWSARLRNRGFGVAFSVAGAAFLLAAIAWIWIPETRNRELV